MKIKLISVDLQKDFSSKGGIFYLKRPSVEFVKNTTIPFLKEKKIKVAEIISDYRQPRPGDTGDCCHPGEWGYESEIPHEVKHKEVWIKCMNSPIWIRENRGVPNKNPGLPYQDSKKFTEWLDNVIGKSEEVDMVVLFGLTLDCCVFCAAQELTFRAYNVKILEEGVDTFSGNHEEKEYILNNPPLTNWAKVISWSELKNQLS